jgi:hypothetical protein
MSKLLTKKKADPLPGFGQDNVIDTPQELAQHLGIPLTKWDGSVAVCLGTAYDDEWSADIELVGMGQDSAYGLSGAPMVVNKEAYCVMVVLKQHGQTVLMLDPHQWKGGDQEVIENTIEAQLSKAQQLMDKAYGEK